MQSLPTAVPTADLDALLAALEQMPSATVKRHADVVTVTATRKATGETVKVLSAVTRDGHLWHVMTVPGLISVKLNATK
jgi:hypothetical protein